MQMTRQTARIAACGVHMFIIGVFGTHHTFAQAQPALVRCRPGIVTVRGGPGSAAHRFASRMLCFRLATLN